MPDLTQLQFTILRSAVNIARDQQIRNVAQLRQQLLKRYPKKPKSIQAALVFWSTYVQRKS